VVVPGGLLGEVADKRKCARSSLTWPAGTATDSTTDTNP
jgi:hypothetical protein